MTDVHFMAIQFMSDTSCFAHWPFHWATRRPKFEKFYEVYETKQKRVVASYVLTFLTLVDRSKFKNAAILSRSLVKF